MVQQPDHCSTSILVNGGKLLLAVAGSSSFNTEKEYDIYCTKLFFFFFKVEFDPYGFVRVYYDYSEIKETMIDIWRRYSVKTKILLSVKYKFLCMLLYTFWSVHSFDTFSY